jgi:deoxyadenosine/deoxycytidine kinase
MKIVVEGNIGSGKSTLCRSLNDATRVPIFLEPVDAWKDWLKLFYTDMSRYGFGFNVQVLLTFHEWKENTFKAIYERSPYSCRHVFTALQHASGKMTDTELDTFHKLFNTLKWCPDVIIYVKTDPKTCLERTKKRNRECESNVTLEYLEAVHDKYEDMIEFLRRQGVQVFQIDGSQDAKTVHNMALDIINSL